jgi:hypothetical protein
MDIKKLKNYKLKKTNKLWLEKEDQQGQHQGIV